MKKVLLICGSLNQTTMMHQIANHLQHHDCYFSPFYSDGILEKMSDFGLLNFTILGGKHREMSEEYLLRNELKIDRGGIRNKYDLVVIGTDTLLPKNIIGLPMILVQEGMIEKETPVYHFVRKTGLPRYLANTAITGMSDAYNYFCVASEGYRQLFIRRGIKSEKIVVTGIPNFDNAISYQDNDFQYHHFVLVATSSMRETFQKDDRLSFIKRAVEIAGNKLLIFKLHPNENMKRAKKEILQIVPDAIILEDGNLHHMIANCDVFICQTTSAVFTGLALGKEVYSYLDLDELRELLPIQNGGKSAENIAQVCEQFLD
jgi:hypothetical protein